MRILSVLTFLAVNVFASYAPVVGCFLLFPPFFKNTSASDLLYYPVMFAELLRWLSGLSINGHAPPDWSFLIGFLMAIGLVSVLFYRVKKAWFWVPFILFWVCLFQDVAAIQVITALGPGFGALGAD